MLSKTHTKYIQNLSHKKFRDETGLFFAEGTKTVLDLLRSRKFVCKEILALEDWMNRNGAALAVDDDCKRVTIAEFELKKISALATPNQVLAVFEKAKVAEFVDLKGKLVLALDTIQDPGNLGTIIRIADWFGITDIVCSNGCADQYNPKVVQSTMGSLGRVNLHYVDLATWLDENRQAKKYAAALQGKNIGSFGKLSDGILIIGNEANGISNDVMQLVDENVTIPRIGEAESLNAAVAAGILLSHLV